ncbi:hypothetical protein G7054_g643 [Neopestalotiopsis clavispora]|nr:hypothetical protein G7054_g643 [Neopestalotiopsis clavispora]
MAHNSIVSYGTWTGIASPDSAIPNGTTGPTYMEGMKVCAALLPLVFPHASSDICLTMMSLDGHLVANILHERLRVHQDEHLHDLDSPFCSAKIHIFPLRHRRGDNPHDICHSHQRLDPVPTTAASWGEVKGECMDVGVLITLTYVVSGLNIATDWSVALLPIGILWKLQMPRKVKIAVSFVLGLGVFSSVATIVRLQYSSAYTATTDYLVGLGHLIEWTVIECDVAIIAGSLPMLRHLIKPLRKEDSEKKSGQSTELVTIGRLGMKKGPVYDTIHESDNLEYFDDKTNESTRSMVPRSRAS